MGDDAPTLWAACAVTLSSNVSAGTWRSTFNFVEPLDYDGRTLALAVPSTFVKERLEGRFRSLIEDALRIAGAGHARLDVHVISRSDSGSRPDDTTLDTVDIDGVDLDAIDTEVRNRDLPVGDGRLDDLDVDLNGTSRRLSSEDEGSNHRLERPGPTWGRTAPREPINDLYTFDAFVTGASNRFAHAAALAVAETPGRSYNPLFVYGAAGLGKTHLLQAIAHYVGENYPDHMVRYVSSETFLNQFVDAIRSNATTEFKRRYREIDVLLVDDIQFMEGKEGLQEEFFHTFNYLHQGGRQIVLSSDRPPDAISTLEDRLRSRFKMGLITDIQPPELETRLAILHKKAEQMTGPVPPDVMDFIASNITNNIRELEGALIRVAAFASLNDVKMTMPLAEQVLADSLRNNRPRVITPQLILEATCAQYGFDSEDLCGKSRRRPLVAARQVAMYVMRELTDLSYPNIAKEFGGRDHTTVIHAVEKIGALMKERRQIYDQVTDLIATIKGTR